MGDRAELPTESFGKAFDHPRVATALLLRGPYLQRATPTGLIVRWRTDVTTDSRVSYGLDPQELDQVAEDSKMTVDHEVELSGLMPETLYYYAVGSTSQVLGGGDASTFFITPPPVGAESATRIWVIGDSGTGDQNARAVRDAYRAYATSSYTNLWLMLGDNAYSSGTDAQYQTAVFDMYPDLLRQTVLWPTLGNHDGVTAQSANQTGPYYKIFTLPRAGEAGGVASGTEAYYAFDHANIHFVVLDSHETDRSVGSAMLSWLEADLASVTAPWVIAFWHHPPYSKGSHDSDVDLRMSEMRQNVLPILDQYGVDLVLAGHSHSYERSMLLDGHYGTSSTLTSAMMLDAGDGRLDGDGSYEKATYGMAPHEGAVYVVAGNAGKISGGALDHPAMRVSLNRLGSMVLDIEGNRLEARFLDNVGQIADAFTLVKGDSVAASVAGRAWLDVDQNGLRDAGETGLSGIHVELLDGGGTVASTQSDATGRYSFAGLDPGLYSVRFILPAGHALSPQDQGIDDAIDSDADPVSGESVFFSLASSENRQDLDAGMFALAPPPPPPQSSHHLITTGSLWRFLDDGSDQGTAWTQPSFDDASWAAGAAQLGYGDGDEVTTVSFGSDAANKQITTYFRHRFEVAEATVYQSLSLRLQRDDGAVIHLNGVEVHRSNMPGGAIDASTLAVSAVANAAEDAFFPTEVSAASLVSGTNVLAVEIHQVGPTSSDLSFDLELEGIVGESPPPPPPDPDPVDDVIFADHFEILGVPSWSTNTTDGDGLQITTNAALSGGAGLEALVDDRNDLWVQDLSPDGEKRYRARFFFDPSSLAMNEKSLHNIFRAYSSSPWKGVVTIQLRRKSGQYWLRTRAGRDSGSDLNGSWVAVESRKMAIEFDWLAASAPGQNDGYLRLFVDQALVIETTGIDNDERVVDFVRLGIFGGIDDGTLGLCYFDDFVSHHTTGIDVP